MKNLALVMFLVSATYSTQSFGDSKQVSGCVLILGTKDSLNEGTTNRQRLVVLEPFQSGKKLSGQGRASFFVGGKKWDLTAGFTFEEQIEGKFDGSLTISINGLSGSTGTRVHYNSVSYSEDYFIPENGKLNVIGIGDEAFRRADLAPFTIFTLCVPSFSEMTRSDTIYL